MMRCSLYLLGGSVISTDKKYLVATGIGLFAFVYASFFLQGLRLFDNDYNQWLTYARENSLATALWQVFNPILSAWNVDFRPTQTLIFKALFALFDYNASGYYYFKALMLALFSAGYFLLLRRYLGSPMVAALSAIFLVTASSTFTSLYWISDFVIVSEFLALLVFAIFLHLESLEQVDRKTLIVWIALMVILTLICDRTKANGKLIPAILFLYLLLFDRSKLKRYGVAIVLMVVILLPWPVLLSDPAPFLVAKAGTPAAYAWQPASLQKFWILFAGDFAPYSLLYSEHPPISVTAVLGFPLVYLGLFAAGWLIYRRVPASPPVRFMMVWLVVNLLALMSYPYLPAHFQARYAISVLIPLVPLILLVIQSAFGRISNIGRWSAGLLTVFVLVQIGFNVFHTVRMRNIGMPGFMIASGAVREYIASNFSDAGFIYYNMPVFAFRPTTDGNQFFSSGSDPLSDVIAALPAGTPLYVISSTPIYSPDLGLHAAFPGRSDNWYDRIFNRDAKQLPITFYLYEMR